MESEQHPDFHPIYPEGKNGAHTMSGIREMIREVALPPYQAQSKVFLIHQAEDLTENCQNALLKTLEEPLPKTYIFLLCENLGSLLLTILSRCLLLRFSPINQDLIANYLQGHKGIEANEAKNLAAFSQGSFARSLELAEKKEDKAIQLIRELLTERLLQGLPGWYDLLLEIDGLEDTEKNREEALLEEIAFWFRDLSLVRDRLGGEFLYNQENKENLENQVKVLILPPMAKLHEIFSKAHQALKAHVRLRHVLEALLLQLTVS
jgi:DNA polymerase III subunit delta'